MARKEFIGRSPAVTALRPATARDFRGGLNTFDDPLNLKSIYQIELLNMYPDTNGRLNLRFGTSLFSDTLVHLDEIIATEYFGTTIIAVGKNGKIVSIDSAGVVTLRWDSAIAAALPGAPAGWSTGLVFASFTQFAGKLVICNGVDKPLSVSAALAFTYLQDAGTGSNTNVPRAKFCATHNNYLVLAVTPTDDTTLYIGNEGTAGTFVGDPAPNDAVNFSMATYVTRGSVSITGLRSFRDRLIVSFAENIIPVQLGQYDSSATPKHVPTVEDAIDNFGAVSHNCMVPIGDDILFLDIAGISSVQRALLTNAFTPQRESTLVGTDIQAALKKFTTAQLQNNVFAMLDRVAQHVLFFIPVSSTVTATTDNDVYVFCYDRAQKFKAMTLFNSMAYRCGCRTAEGRLFLSQGTKVYYYRNRYEPLYTDYSTTSQQPWDDGSYWDDGTGWFDTGADQTYYGTPISFAWSTPWTDFRAPTIIKESRYLTFDAKGAGNVTTDMYIDRFSVPELSMSFYTSDDPLPGSPGTRPANNEQVHAWPCKFRRMRLRFSGTSSAALAFTAVNMLYLPGSIRR